MLEDDLRRALIDEAAAAPPAPAATGLADAAVRDARRHRRRRRSVLGAAAGVFLLATLGIAVAGTGAVRNAHRPALAGPAATRPRNATLEAVPTTSGPPSSSWPEPSLAPDLDVVTAGALSTMDGRLIPLPDPALTRAYRVPLGWLALSASNPSLPLWLIRPDGSAHELLAGVSAAGLAVAPDGQRIAWQRGAGAPLTTATLSATGLTERRVVTVGARVVLAGWFGRYVALGEHRGTGTGGFDRVDVWDPAVAYRAGATSAAVGILGLAADRAGLLGLARPTGRGAPACLVRLDPERRLAAGKRRCLPDLTASGRFALSPDGRLLAGTADATHVVVVDIAGTGSGRPVMRIACDRDAQQVWADARTLVIASPRRGLLRYRVGSAGAVAVGGTGHGPVSLVPRLGS